MTIPIDFGINIANMLQRQERDVEGYGEGVLEGVRDEARDVAIEARDVEGARDVAIEATRDVAIEATRDGTRVRDATREGVKEGVIGPVAKTKSTFSEFLLAVGVDASDPIASMIGKKKKKIAVVTTSASSSSLSASENLDVDAQYYRLLRRLYDKLVKEVELSSIPIRRNTVTGPRVVRDGSKKSAFTNYREVCKSINRERDEDHVIAFINSELLTVSTIDASNSLILKGIFTSAKIESILRKYIEQFVICPQCRNLNTILERNSITRLSTICCQTCKASRTITSIKTGYCAQIGHRKR